MKSCVSLGRFFSAPTQYAYYVGTEKKCINETNFLVLKRYPQSVGTVKNRLRDATLKNSHTEYVMALMFNVQPTQMN